MIAREIAGYGDMVVSPHHLATTAGLETFSAGGSATDAAIAVDAVLGVVAPETCGIGGDLFALVWEPSASEPVCLNASGPAGSNADPDELRDLGMTRMPHHHPASVTIPGCVAGWIDLLQRHGRLSLADVLEPAIDIAQSGFAVSTELARTLAAASDSLPGQPSARDLYPDRRPPPAGTRIVRRPLASTLEAIASHGMAAFYQGSTAAAIARAVDDRITAADLSAFRPEWVEPARLDIFGSTGWTIPLNSQGYLTLATLGIFERLGLTDPTDPRWTHMLVESYRSVAWERNDVVSDPRSAPHSWRQLLDPDRLAARAAAVDPFRAGTYPTAEPVPGGTAYMCAVGRDGQAVSLIQSNFMGIGARIGVGDTGFLLHNRGAGFDLRRGHPNELRPGRRPLHTLSPTMWTREGTLSAVLGTRGGNQQPQILAQVAARVFGAGHGVDQAQSAPRWTIDEFGPGSTPVVQVEAGYPDEAVDHLRSVGHRVEPRSGAKGGWGPVSIITIDDAGLRRGAADPRVDTTMAAARR